MAQHFFHFSTFHLFPVQRQLKLFHPMAIRQVSFFILRASKFVNRQAVDNPRAHFVIHDH